MVLSMLLVALLQATVMIESIAQGRTSTIEEPREAIVRSAQELQALWKEHAGAMAPPKVDFANAMVAAVFLGTRPSGGYGVEITGTRRDGNTLVIEYVERRPAADALVTQALTAPFHIVRLPRHDGMVSFSRVTPPPSIR